MIESFLKSIVDTANIYIWESPAGLPWLVVLLLGTGIYVTFRMGWINFRKFGHAVNVIRGQYDNPEDEGDINHFQALATALSATIGVGNIAGVALGIHYGGPGVILWLWVSGLFGMTLKYAECTLSLHYRTFDKKGHASGGPMYSIERGLGKNWKWMAILFAGLTIISTFGIGCMNQSNTVAVSAASDFNAPDWIVGLILAFLVALVILGGIKRIGAVTSKLLPTMAFIYIMGALFILITHIQELPSLFASIVTEAFRPKAAFGGTAVGMWNLTLLWGIKRALFSNEAGMGSAPIAHAAAKTKEPVREGLVAMVGPFVDTLMVCTLTGLIIVLTGVWDKKKPDLQALDVNKIIVYQKPDFDISDRSLHTVEGASLQIFQGTTQIDSGKAEELIFVFNDGLVDDPLLLKDGKPYTGNLLIENNQVMKGEDESLSLDITGKMLQNSSALTAFAFQKGFKRIGKFGNLIVTICVFLFALSTIISWSYYGDRCVEYLFGVKYVIIYRIIFVGFTYLGAVLALETVWAFGDMALGLMVVPNLISVLLLSPKLVPLTKDYFSRKHKRFK